MKKRVRGIDEGDHVTIKIGDLPEMEARIEGLGDTYAIIGLFKEPEPPLSQLGPMEAVIEATSARGLARVVGTMRQYENQPDAVRLDFDDGPEVIQRRQFVRIESTTGVSLTRENGDKVRTHTVNLSGAGLLLAGPDDLELDESLRLAIDVGAGELPIHARGRVVRETREGNWGVRIEMIEEGDRERLIRFVFERQRRAPRVRVR